MALSTLGVRLGYCVATTAGTAPTTGYTELVGIKSIPAVGGAPETYDATSLNATQFKEYVQGLMDTGGALELRFNNTNEIQTQWGNLVTAYEADKVLTSPKGIWFAVIIPGLTNGFYLEGTPSILGLAQIDVGNVLEVSGYVTPTKILGWSAKATIGTTTP